MEKLNSEGWMMARAFVLAKANIVAEADILKVLKRFPRAHEKDSNNDYEKILAFVILLLTFLSLPLLLFTFILTVILNISYIIKFYYTRNLVFILLIIILSVLNISFIFGLKYLISWLRT